MGQPLSTKERITQMETKLDITVEKVNEINNKLDKFIDSADHKYATVAQTVDQERRLRIVEKAVWLGIGGLAILQVLLQTTS